MSNPEASVVIPVYNAERFIAQCIKSVLDQTMTDFELICVNDGSTDRSMQIMSKLAEGDPRIRIIDQPNKGEGAARNAGLDAACGTFLFFFDADDFTDPHLLEIACSTAKRTNADVVVYRVDSYNDETGETLPIPWSLDTHAFPDEVSSHRDNPDQLFSAFQNWTWNKLFRADFIHDCKLRFHEIQRSADLYFVCCALVKAQRIATVDKVLYHYRVNNPSSNIATNERAPLDFYQSFVAVKEYLQNEKLYEPVKRGFVNWAAESVFFNFSSLKSRAAFEDLRQEMKERGCALLDIDTLPQEDFFDQSVYDQVQHLLNDNSDEFLFSQLRAANRKSELRLSDSLRAIAATEEVYGSKTYRTGDALLKPLKMVLGR